jgi:PadR family transcriptional regulator PadR
MATVRRYWRFCLLSSINLVMAPRALGDAEQLILFALVALPPEDCYGVPIRELIEQRTGRSISAGAVYTALDRLAARGLVSSCLGAPTAQRGGRPTRLYALERAGARELSQSYATLDAMSQGLVPLLDLHVAGSSHARKRRT